MYGNGFAPIGAGGAGALAATGTGSIVLPIVVVSLGLLIGALMIIRNRWMAKTSAH